MTLSNIAIGIMIISVAALLEINDRSMCEEQDKTFDE
jgi:hypothetical protein